MKRKKTFLLWGIVIFVMFTQPLARAQSALYSTGGVTVNLPTLQYGGVLPNQQYYTLFVEMGDGFYKKSGRIENAGRIPAQYIPYSYKVNTAYNAMANIVGHYDTFPPPLRQILVQLNSNNGAPTDSKQTKLTQGSNIGFDFSDTTLVPGDTTTMVLTYRPDAVKRGQDSADYVIAFYYNYTGGESAGIIFSEITNSSQQFAINGTVLNTNVIRTTNSEIPYTDIPGGNIIPASVSSILSSNKIGYNNAVYFIIPHNASVDEKNIFISLFPDRLNGKNYSGTTSTFKLEKIKYYKSTGNIASSPEIKSLILPITFLARDPNGITITPGCFNPGNTKKLATKISFQNDGPGDAENVTVTMHVPTGMQFPILNLAPVLHNGSQSDVFIYHPGGTNAPGYYYSFDVVHGDIIFLMNGIKLKGTHPLPTPPESKRKREITFDLKAMISPLDQCENMDVSIVFVTKMPNGDLKKINPATTTTPIRTNCKPGQGPCPRLSPGGQ